MDVKPLRLFSYTRCQKDDDCRRARYYAREFGGEGIVAAQSGWNLRFGDLQHRYLEQLAQTSQLNYDAIRQEVLAAAVEYYTPEIARDWAALAEGQLRGFVRSVWPGLLAEYSIMETEKWIEWEPAPGFRFRARQDLLLCNKFDGHLAYVDYKTTSSYKPQWIASWAKSVQLHSSMYALKQSTGVEVQRAIVIGLYKGYRDDKTGAQRSVFSNAWCNRQFAMSPEYSYTYTRARGWESFPTYDEFPNLEPWIAGMPMEILTQQFPTTGPIFPRADIAETYFRQQLIREAEVGEAVQLLQVQDTEEGVTALLDKHFKQNFSKCEPAYGYKCEYIPICWQPWVAADPVGSGLFKVYESDVEVE